MLLFADGFDYYATAVPTQLLNYWTSAPVGGSVGSIAVGEGRNGSNAYNEVLHRALSKTLVDRSTWILGTAIKRSNEMDPCGIFELLDDALTQVSLRVRADGRIELKRSTGTVIDVGDIVLHSGVWYYVELKVTIGNSGTYEWRVNEIVDKSGSADTQATSNNTADVFVLGSIAVGSQTRFDDCYACDDNPEAAGPSNDDYLGDVFVEALFPAAEGTTIQWTPLTGSDNAAMIDDNPPDDDATYNSDDLSVPGHIDTFEFGNMSTASGEVFGVIWMALARKDDSGVRTIAPVVRPAATDKIGGNQNIGSTTYTYYYQVYAANPETNAQWTISEVNDTEFGYKAVA